MSDLLTRVKLKGNESFNIREGWLRKGMKNVEQYEDLFSREDMMEILGVGSKMVKSIRYWLQATNLCEEKYDGRKRIKKQVITPKFGELIKRYDPFFDDVFTLSLLHYNIVANKDGFCTIWNIFFNEFKGNSFTKENFYDFCETSLNKKISSEATYSLGSMKDDCTSVLRMYCENKNESEPEENLGSPFSELRLLSKNAKGIYNKTMPPKDVLDKYAVLFVIISSLDDGKTSVNIDALLNDDNNIGKVFNLTRNSINEYLDQLQAVDLLTVNRTAGLDVVYLKEGISASDVITMYFQKSQVR